MAIGFIVYLGFCDFSLKMSFLILLIISLDDLIKVLVSGLVLSVNNFSSNPPNFMSITSYSKFFLLSAALSRY